AGLISWALGYRLDRANKDVTVTLLGFGRSRAVYRGELGCVLDHGRAVGGANAPVADSTPPLLPEIGRTAVVTPQDPQLAAALDRAFAEPGAPPFKRTRAVVVVKDCQIIAERYAEGFGIDRPILGFSSTKSVISALTGILVRKGMLTLDKPAPV